MILPSLAFGKPDSKGPKPAPSPGWVIVEESLWYPWIYEPVDWFHDAEMHYRKRKEEKAAAANIRKAEAWLNAAATEAAPMTKKSLTDAAGALSAVAYDLEQGKIQKARAFDNAITKASHALAEWHYFKANDKLAKNDEKLAAQVLQAAARYLKYAADSAGYEYGDTFVSTYDEISGWTTSEIVPSSIEKNLKVVRGELDKLAAALEKPSRSTQ